MVQIHAGPPNLVTEVLKDARELRKQSARGNSANAVVGLKRNGERRKQECLIE